MKRRIFLKMLGAFSLIGSMPVIAIQPKIVYPIYHSKEIGGCGEIMMYVSLKGIKDGDTIHGENFLNMNGKVYADGDIISCPRCNEKYIAGLSAKHIDYKNPIVI